MFNFYSGFVGKIANLTFAYLSDGWFNHQLEKRPDLKLPFLDVEVAGSLVMEKVRVDPNN